MVNPVGFRFCPTDKELVDHYLRLKNSGGSTNHVDQVISTVDICSFDPWDLPSQSGTESRDLVWYFFGRKENKYNKGERQRRKTSSGYWKKTGVTMDITGKKRNREKIGEKRVLVFHSRQLLGGSKTKWVMHEFVSPNENMPYTICKVVFKGDARDMSSYAAKEVEHSHPLIPLMNNYDGFEFTGVLDMDALDKVFDNLLNANWNDDDNDEHTKISSMQ